MESSRSAKFVVTVTLLVALMSGCGGGGGGGDAPPPPPPAPSSPGGVTAAPGNGQAAISWTAVSGATSYNVYTSSTSPATTASTRTTVSGTSTTLSSLTNGTPVFAAVTAVNAGGESGLSSEVCAVPTPASTTGLTLYDPLCGSTLDGAKWQPPGLFTRGVSNGAMLLSTRSSNMEANSSRGFVNQTVAVVNAGTQRVTTLQATIMVPAASVSRSAGVEARAVVRLLYQPPANRLDVPAGNLDLLSIQVGLEDVGNGPVAIRRVTHCDNAACSTESSTGIVFSDPTNFNGTVAAAYDTTYTVSASLNETTGVFSWTISGGALGTLSGTADPSAYLVANANWAALAPNPLAGAGFFSGLVRTRVLGLTGGLAGSISAQFDDVLVGFNNNPATAWDDFSGGSNSGPLELRADKWTAGEHSRAMAGSSLAERSQVTSPNTSGISYAQAVLFSDPAASNTIQADVTVNACANSSGSTNRVELVGTLYNDGTAGTGTPPDTNQANSSVGDVQAHLMLDCVLGNARFQLIRWNTQSPQTGTLLSSSVNNTVPMGSAPVIGNMHTLRMKWDPSLHQVTFQVDGAAPVVVDPTIASAQILVPTSVAKAANSPFRAIGESLFIPNAAGSVGATASIDYKVNNVFTAP
jgi:hypothetical protein